MCVPIRVSSNGRTADSDSAYRGSNPCTRTIFEVAAMKIASDLKAPKPLTESDFEEARKEAHTLRETLRRATDGMWLTGEDLRIRLR
jgi:hypothetical protein